MCTGVNSLTVSHYMHKVTSPVGSVGMLSGYSLTWRTVLGLTSVDQSMQATDKDGPCWVQTWGWASNRVAVRKSPWNHLHLHTRSGTTVGHSVWVTSFTWQLGHNKVLWYRQ